MSPLITIIDDSNPRNFLFLADVNQAQLHHRAPLTGCPIRLQLTLHCTVSHSEMIVELAIFTLIHNDS